MAQRRKTSADQLTPAMCNKHLRASRWTVIKKSAVVSKLITVDDLPRLTYFSSVISRRTSAAAEQPHDAQIFRLLRRFGLINVWVAGKNVIPSTYVILSDLVATGESVWV